MILFKDEYEIEQLKERVQQGQRIAKAIADEFNKLPLNPVKTSQQVKQLVQDTETFISNAIQVPDGFNLLGFKISRAKLAGLIDMDTEPLKAMIRNADKPLLAEFFENAADKIEISPAKLTESMKRWEVSAATPREIRLAEAMIQIQKGLIELEELGANRNYLINQPLMGNLVVLNSGKIVPNIRFFSRLSKG